MVFIDVYRRVAAIKERLLQRHLVGRLTYANNMINWNLVDWSRGIFIDEFTIESGDRGRVWVWRLKGTRYESRNIATVNHTRRFKVSFIVLQVLEREREREREFTNSCEFFSFSFHGLCPFFTVDTLNRESYEEFLEQRILPYIDQHFDDGNVLLLHDSHPVYN